MQTKKLYAILGVTVIVLSSFAMLVYAATWTPDDMAVYMQNVGRHKIYQTNWILYNQIGPQVDDIQDDLAGEYDSGTWTTTGTGYTDYVLYNVNGIPKKFSFWINVRDLGGVDELVFTIKYETSPPLMEKVETRTFTGDQDNNSVLLVDQLPVATRVAVEIEQTAGGTANEVKYHAIIEEN